MDPNWRYRHGMRPTLRHLMLLVLAVALVSSSVTHLGPAPVGRIMWVDVTLILGLSPALLAVLVFMFDRPGPAKNWLAGVLARFTLPGLVAGIDVVAWKLGTTGLWYWLLVPVNGLALLILGQIWTRRPARCPECGLRSLLPLSTRLSGLWWCATCGHSHRGTSQAALNPRN